MKTSKTKEITTNTDIKGIEAYKEGRQEVIADVEDICKKYQMYADMDTYEFWKTSTISPQEAEKRAKYCWELLKRLKREK